MLSAIDCDENPPTLAMTGTRPDLGRRSRATAYARPLLGTPMESAIDSVSGKRTSRGNGLPYRASGMIDPTQIETNPSVDNAATNSAFLSKPAASPTGFDISRPAKRVSSLASTTFRWLMAASRCQGNAHRMAACARLWLRSAERLNSADLRRSRYGFMKAQLRCCRPSDRSTRLPGRRTRPRIHLPDVDDIPGNDDLPIIAIEPLQRSAMVLLAGCTAAIGNDGDVIIDEVGIAARRLHAGI